MSNASSVDCFTVGDAKTTIAVFSVFGTIAILFYVAAILLIIKSRAHRQFVHRLSLYLAFGGLLRAATLWLTVAPVDIKLPDNDSVSLRDGWDGLCVFSAVLTQYSVFFQTFTVMWMCLYIFVAVVFQRQLQSVKCEIVGIVTILLAPLIFAWEPFLTNSYGLSGTRCWIKISAPCSGYDLVAYIYGMVTNLIPQLLLNACSLGLLLASILALIRKAVLVQLQSLLGRHYWLAVKEIAPLILYPLLYTLIYLASVISLVDAGAQNDTGISDLLGTMMFVAGTQTCSILLLLSLMIRSSVRKVLCQQRRQGERDLLSSVSAH